MGLWIVLTLKILYSFVIIVESSPITINERRCELITMPFCKTLLYNETTFPNLLNHQTQEDAQAEVHQFTPLVKVNCSPDLKSFLCSVYAPICNNGLRPVLPCRHLCESAKHNCADLMNNFGFSWPEHLECSKFPDAAGDNITCFGPKINPYPHITTTARSIPSTPSRDQSTASVHQSTASVAQSTASVDQSTASVDQSIVSVDQLTASGDQSAISRDHSTVSTEQYYKACGDERILNSLSQLQADMTTVFTKLEKLQEILNALLSLQNNKSILNNANNNN